MAAFATSYIKTTSAQVTRNADAASMTGTNFSSWYRPDEGTLYAEVKTSAAALMLQIDDNSVNNRITMVNRLSGSGSASSVIVGGVAQADPSVSGFTSGFNKIGVFFETNSFAAVVNAGSAGTDASLTLPVVSRMTIGYNQSGTMTGAIKKLAYYPQALTDANLQALTA